MEKEGGRKREAENRAFVRLVGRLDKELIELLLRLARAMEGARGDEAVQSPDLEKAVAAIARR